MFHNNKRNSKGMLVLPNKFNLIYKNAHTREKIQLVRQTECIEEEKKGKIGTTFLSLLRRNNPINETDMQNTKKKRVTRAHYL